jgi:hypothetical protein
MSAITFNWAPFEIKTEVDAPTERLVNIGNGYSREEEFRYALDSYIADYRKSRRIKGGKKLF